MKVYINVYDIMRFNKYLDCMGVGAYHTGKLNYAKLKFHLGIEVNGSEYAYGGNSLIDTTGVYEILPKSHEVF